MLATLWSVVQEGDSSPDSGIGLTLTVNNTLVTILVGTIIPLVNGLLVRPSNPAWVKTLLASLLAVAATAFSQAIQADGSAFLSQEWFLTLAVTWIAMIATYYGLWKPTLNPNEALPTLPVGDGVEYVAGKVPSKAA